MFCPGAFIISSMKTVVLLIVMSLGISVSLAADLTDSFKDLYKNKATLSVAEKAALKAVDIYLVPGIMAESFDWSDTRSYVDFSFATRNYFSTQRRLLKKNGFSAKVIRSSSYSVEETKAEIAKAIGQSTLKNRKTLFMTHSLGGLALLDELVSNEIHQENVLGVIFLQSPFAGSPMADLYQRYPYQSDVWLKPLLPFFNTSEATVAYLSIPARQVFMEVNAAAITRLINKLPVITVGGVANGARSIFDASVDVLAHGCVKTLGRCTTRQLHTGPYDDSDGLVPFKSSRLLGADYVKLRNADHGELVVNTPFESYDKKNLTISLLKLLLSKTNQ